MKGITDSAAEALKEALEEDHVTDEKCVRFIGSAYGGEMEVDHKCPGDRTFEYDGRTVLVVGPETLDACSDQVLGYENGHFCLFGDRRKKGHRSSEVAELAYA